MAKGTQLDHIYDDYGLYSLYYSREFDVKAFEALNAIVAASDFYHRYLKREKVSGLRILELFAGRSEHKDFFVNNCGLPIETYSCLDNAKHLKTNPEPGVVYGDALHMSKLGNTNYNLMLSFFHSLNGPIDLKASEIDRKTVLLHLKNAASILKRAEIGAYFLHLGNPGLGPIAEQVSSLDDEEVVTTTMYVHAGHRLRTQYKVAPSDTMFVEFVTSSEYRRSASTMYTKFKTIRVMSSSPTGRNPKVLNWITVRTPFIFRTWSENEMIDMMREAGFTDFLFYHNNKDSYTSNAERIELEAVIKSVDLTESDLKSPEQMSAFTSTEILAII